MTTNVLLLLLASVMLCGCVSSMQAQSCRCIHRITKPLPPRIVRNIRKVEVIPISGACRRTEIIFTMAFGKIYCVDSRASWVSKMIEDMQKQEAKDSSTDSPLGSRNTKHVLVNGIL